VLLDFSFQNMVLPPLSFLKQSLIPQLYQNNVLNEYSILLLTYDKISMKPMHSVESMVQAGLRTLVLHGLRGRRKGGSGVQIEGYITHYTNVHFTKNSIKSEKKL
jgi:hypothetical protein